MSNINDYDFAKKLDIFKTRVLDPQAKRTEEARVIMHDPTYNWPSEEARKTAASKYDNFKAWLAYYQEFYDAGLKLSVQHEKIVNSLCKWYGRWYDEVSNDGKQETELMSMQADALNEIFSEIWKEIQPLGLNINPPKALNLQ